MSAGSVLPPGAGGEAAGTGLVSFSNKVESISDDAEKGLKECEAHHRRMWRKQKGVIASARLIHNDLVARGVKFRAALVTLTYRPGAEWAPRQITELLQHYVKWAKRRGFKFRAVWGLEPHADGRPHYHIVFWMPRGLTPPMPDRQGWWPHGMTNAKWARSPVGYIAKYCAKPAEDKFPKGARIWGAVGLSMGERCQVQWNLAPRWVKRLTDPAKGVRRLRRFLTRVFDEAGKLASWRLSGDADSAPWHTSMWTCMRTGFSFEAPYTCEGFKDGALVLSPRERPRCWDESGDQHFYAVRA